MDAHGTGFIVILFATNASSLLVPRDRWRAALTSRDVEKSPVCLVFFVRHMFAPAASFASILYMLNHWQKYSLKKI